MRVGSYELRPDWGQIAFASALTAWVVWYYFDAHAASPHVQNMLLIRPVTVIVLMIYVVIVYQALNVRPVGVPETVPDEPQPAGRELRGPLVAGSLVAYVLAMPYLGFDLATAIFIAATMAAAGERRLWVLAVISIGFAAFLILGFRFALSTPVPSLLL